DEGRPLLSDFGIAKMIDVEDSVTRPGFPLGTPDYMAPEQLQGRPADPRVDVYALGTLTYELLTGRLPFSGGGLEVMQQKIERDPPPLRRFVPALPAAAEAVVLRAIARRPEARFRSAGEFARVLAAALPGTSAADGARAASPPPYVVPAAADPAQAADYVSLPTTAPIISPVARPARARARPFVLAGLLVLIGIVAFGAYLIAADPAARSRAVSAAPAARPT